jgi:MFS family permease
MRATSTVSQTSLRCVVRAVGAGMFLDTLLFGLLAPLLPHYVDDLRLSKATAGALAGACGAGAVVMALPAGALSGRIGGRRVVLLGLSVMAVASVAFCLSHSTVPMIATRFLQGAAGVAVWAGGLSWATALAPEEQRGQVVGTLLGLGVTGMIVGPLAGGLAVATSPWVVFAAIPVAAAVVAVAVSRLPDAATPTATGGLGELLRRPALRRTAGKNMWLMLLAASATGLVSALGPLRLDRFGASGAAIAAVFLVAGGAEAGFSPLAGRTADTHGARVVLAGATTVLGTLLLLFLVPSHIVPLAATIVGLSVCLGCFGAPVGRALSLATTRAGLGEAPAFALFNLTFASGNVLGATGGSALAQVAGDSVPALGLAALALLSAAVVPALLD